MSTLYQPTPTEEAYGIYLIEQVFGKSRVQNFNMTAKEASSLMSKSGVNTLILDNIWTVAGPDNTKRLTNVGQFYVILRLVALAQDGMLEQEMTRAFKQRRGQTTPMEVIQQTLWMSADYKDCPLPVFEGIPVPSKDFLKKFHQKRQRQQQHTSSIPAAPTPAPAPMPIRKPTPARGKTPPPLQPTPRQSSVASEATEKPAAPRSFSSAPSPEETVNYESAIHQLESLSMDASNTTVTNVNSLKHLDADSFELIQEQAALQMVILESKSTAHVKPEQGMPLSEEEAALQQALFESSTQPQKQPAPAAAKAPPPESPPLPRKPQNWLRMRSLTEFDGTMDHGNDSDDSYKGTADGARENFLKGQQQSPVQVTSPKKPPPPAATVSPVDSKTPDDVHTDQQARLDEQAAIEASLQLYYAPDRKPAAGPTSSKPPPTKSPEAKKQLAPTKLAPKQATSGAPKPPQRTKSPSCADEYPQAVQELVMNGFELEKAIQGYKMLGDNFDDIVLFLTSDMTVKELVINGFNIRQVVEAYELLGDNMDELIAYLMQDTA